jgi:hypothetical protein
MAETRYLTDAELDRNYDAFKAALPKIIASHRGRHAVVRDATVVDIFDTRRDAYIFGWRMYDDDLFSVQEVTDEPVYLGIYSHAFDFGPS